LSVSSNAPVDLAIKITSQKDELIVVVECGDVKGRQKITVEPNVTYTVSSDNITVTSNEEIVNYKVFDLRGQMISSSIVNANNFKIASSTWPKGMYVLRLESSQTIKVQQKIVIH
jgi:Secretion system C-terminal sorting domain